MEYIYTYLHGLSSDKAARWALDCNVHYMKEWREEATHDVSTSEEGKKRKTKS